MQRLWSNSRGECFAGDSSSTPQSRYTVKGYHDAPVTGPSESAVCPQGTYASTITLYAGRNEYSITGVNLTCSDGVSAWVQFPGTVYEFPLSNADRNGFSSVLAYNGLSCVNGMIFDVNRGLAGFWGQNYTSSAIPTCYGSDVIVGFTNMAAGAEGSQCMASFDIICDSVSTVVPTGMPSSKPATTATEIPSIMPSQYFATTPTGMPSAYPAAAPTGMPSAGHKHDHLASASMKRLSIDAAEESFHGISKKTNLRSKL